MKYFRYFVAWLILLVLSLQCFADQNMQSIHTDTPPSVELAYTVKAEYNGLQLNGNASTRWQTNGQRYSILNEVQTSFLGKILDADSRGTITAQGLVPAKYIEKRLRKTPTTTRFNYTDHTITFRDNKTTPLNEITQDRASIVWQLATIAKTDPQRLTPDATLSFSVAGASKTELWVFHIIDVSNISTPMGQLKTVEFSRSGKKDQKMNVWLAPDHDWYPVQIFFSEQGGLQFLQTVKKITPL